MELAYDEIDGAAFYDDENWSADAIPADDDEDYSDWIINDPFADY